MQIKAKRLKKVFLPNDSEGAWVDIVYLKPGVRTMLDKESNQMTATTLDGSFTPVITFDRSKKQKLFLGELIDGWGGFIDQHKNELEVNDETIALVMREIADFYSWLEEESDTFIAEVEEQEAKAMGNLQS